MKQTLKFAGVYFRGFNVLDSDLPFLCAQAAIQLKRQIKGEDVDYSPTNCLAELLANESRESRDRKWMEPNNQFVLYHVLYPNKEKCDCDSDSALAMRTNLLALELKSVKDLPEERLENLYKVCLDLANKSLYWRSTVQPYSGRRYLAA